MGQKGERWDNSWGRDTEKKDYLLSSDWKDTKKPSDITKIMEIILHLLHQLQYWPGSVISYKDYAYILQLEFQFIPWLFHAWTIAIMFVPNYFFFFQIHTLQDYSELPCLLCFTLKYPCCSHASFLTVILLYVFSYIWNQDWNFNVSLQSFKDLKISRLQLFEYSPVHLLSSYHSCYPNIPSFFCMLKIYAFSHVLMSKEVQIFYPVAYFSA